MKILMLGSKEYPFGVSAHDIKAKGGTGGGIEIHIEKLSKYLTRRGHQVFIITKRFPGQPFNETSGNIQIIRTRYIPGKHLRTFSFNLLSFIKALFLVRKYDIDLIHSHAVIAGFFGTMLSKLTRKPMVFTPHGIDVGLSFPVREILRFFLRASLKGAKRIIFISKTAHGVLAHRTRSPSALLTNAIDLEDYDFKPTRSRDIRFLFLGRLEKVKGVETLIEAFSQLLKKCPKASLTIAGKGSMKNKVVELILKARTRLPRPSTKYPRREGNDRIRYMGWMDSREALQNSDVFVLPSLETGQPVALLEAMASGKIIITSLPFIKPGRTGLSCKANSPENLFKKMLWFAETFTVTKNLEARPEKKLDPLPGNPL
jgi:glycosyltransferase involved in cell wall biosynthesis